MLPINEATLALIKENEGCELHAYQDMVGVWTIGFGHIEGVHEGDTITQEQADQMLVDDLTNNYGPKVAGRIGSASTTANQFGAMVSLAYNVGTGALENGEWQGGFGGSTLAKEHCAGNYAAAAEAFLSWDHAGGHEVEALLRRRREEAELYGTPDPMAADQPAATAEPPSSSPPSPGIAENVAAFETLSATLQAQLKSAGYYSGDLDGDWWTLSRRALQRWKSDHPRR